MKATHIPYGKQVEYIGDDLFIQHTTIVIVVRLEGREVQQTVHFRVTSVWSDSLRKRVVGDVCLFNPRSGIWEGSDEATRTRLLARAASAEWIRTNDDRTKSRDLIWYLRWHIEDLCVIENALIFFMWPPHVVVDEEATLCTGCAKVQTGGKRDTEDPEKLDYSKFPFPV